MNLALLFTVMYGPGDNDSPDRAKFTNRDEAFAFGTRMAVGNANVTMSDKQRRLYQWRNGDLIG